ncbi:MAG: metal-dependent hydrolase, partial [Maribacter stanieri]
MDSLTQIVLGAAVGEAVLGKKVGNKAMLYGAIAGTIPDLDVITRYFLDTVTATEWHRGVSHSIFFSIVFAPIFGWLVWKI